MIKFYDLEMEEETKMDTRDIVNIFHTENCIVIENMDGLFFETKEINFI